MSSSATKFSISLPQDLATAVRRRVGARGLSGFVARAISHELEREQLGAFLDRLADEQGPVSQRTTDEARRVWPKR